MYGYKVTNWFFAGFCQGNGTDRHTDRQTEKQTDKHTDKHTDRYTERQTNRQTDRQYKLETQVVMRPRGRLKEMFKFVQDSGKQARAAYIRHCIDRKTINKKKSSSIINYGICRTDTGIKGLSII